MPSTRLIAVFAVACINLNVAAAIAIPTAAWVNFEGFVFEFEASDNNNSG
jgi:hypothetical protein